MAKKALTGIWFPLTLLLIMILTWGISVPRLGFYLDDWVSVSTWDQAGVAGLRAYALDDSRPFMAYFLQFGFTPCGVNPTAWQVYSLFWRFLAGVMNWLLIRRLFPQRGDAAAFSSILLSIFPFFKHQALCITYHMIWMQLPLLLASFYLMVKAIKAKSANIRALFTIISLTLSLVQLAPSEYYLSVEMARALVIWLALGENGDDRKKRLIATLRVYLPYFLILVAYLVYRFAYLPALIHDRMPIEILEKNHSVGALVLYLLKMFYQYIVMSISGVWFKSLNPAGFSLDTLNAKIACAAGAFVALALGFGMARVSKKEKTLEPHSSLRQLLVLGLFAMILGYIPGILIDKSPATEFLYHDRFLIPSFWGIALATTAAVGLFFRDTRVKIALLSTLCGVSVFFQIQNSAGYRHSWESQQKFHWQMKWRVPDIQENTAIVGDAIIAAYTGGWADGATLLEMYGKKTGIDPAPYWYFSLAENDIGETLRQGAPIENDRKMYRFSAESANVLTLVKPEYANCLLLLEEEDAKNPTLPPETRNLAQYQNKKRILYHSAYQMPAEIFGEDFQRDWCYYYENAALALDMGNYEKALQLLGEADAVGAMNKSPTEMAPFIKAAAYSGQWDKAAELTDRMAYDREKVYEYYAYLWELLLRDTPESAARSQALEKVSPFFKPPVK